MTGWAAVRRLAPLLIAAGLLVPAGVADAQSKRPCKLRGAKTYKKNKQARLVTRKETRNTLEGRALYGCHARTKKRIFLAIRGQYDPDAWLIKLRGRYAAVNYTAMDRSDDRYGFLRLWDLRRARRVISVRNVEASDIEIGPKGQLVFIGNALANQGEADPPLSVRVFARGSRRKTLATGNISLRSLKIRGRTIFWTQDGTVRSAPL